MRKLSVFYKGLFIFLGVLVILISISLIFVWNWLADYQAGLPIYKVDSIIAEVKHGNFQDIVDKYNFYITDFENKKAVVSFLENSFSDYDEITYKKMYTREGHLYAICADKLPVFSVNLVKSNGKYEVVRSELHTKIGVQVKLPKGFTLYINDVKADSKWVEETIDEENTGFKLLFCMKGNDKIIESYRVTGLLQQANVKVTDYEGNNVDLELDKELSVSYKNIKFLVPNSCKVYLNDEEISDEFVTRSNVESDIIGVTLKEYEVDGILGDFTYVVKDSVGSEMETEVSEGKINLQRVNYVIDVPKGYTLYVNGNKVDEINIKEKNVEIKELQYIPDKYVNKPVYDRYSIDVLGSIPSIVVKNKDGFEVKTTLDKKKATAHFNVPEDVAKEYYSIVEERSFMYSKYVTSDLSRDNLQKVLKEDTEIYETYSTLQPYFYTSHIGFEFKDVKIGNLQMYTDNCISCDISYDHYIYKSKTEVFTFPSDFTFYLVNDGGTWFIMDFVIN